MRDLIGALALVGALSTPAVSDVRARAVANNALGAALDAVVSSPTLSSATVGGEVRSLPGGEIIYAREAKKSLRPASILKLVTTAAALDALGSERRFQTTVETADRLDGSGRLAGDVYLVGRGDPSLGGRHAGVDTVQAIDGLVSQLYAEGVRRIEGRLLGYGGAFPGERRGSDWGWEDLVWWYGAEVSALFVNDGCVRLRAAPGERSGDPVVVVADPPSAYYRLVSSATTAAGGTRAELTLNRPAGQNEIRLSGSLAVGDPPWEGWVALEDPACFAATLLAERLRASGISVAGGVASTSEPLPTGLRLLASRQSPTVGEIVHMVNKESHNLGAEVLSRLTGIATSGEGTASAAREGALVLLGRLQVPAEGFVLEDGSGLSRSDLVTAHGMAALLVAMDSHPASAVFRSSLPVAGMDGTLRGRMKGTAAEGRVAAKTGTLRLTSTLAGYVTTRSGRRLAFAFLVNNARSPREANAALDAMAVTLASH